MLTEKGLYGILLTGVYSNGDLAGNYAGFKFYRNLFHEVRIGDRTLAPILRRDGVHWMIDPTRDNTDLLKPYISEHLNETTTRRCITSASTGFAAMCAIAARAGSSGCRISTRRRTAATSSATKTWFGEPYGWDLPDDKAISLLDCFAPAAQ